MSDLAALRTRLAAVPAPAVVDPPGLAALLDAEVAYLASDEAVASLAVDTYWPKWRTPWWSMLLLDELGATERVPARIVTAMVDGLAALPVHTFPLRDEDWPPGADRKRDASCHCAIGCMDRLLRACGVDVDRALPWIGAWFERYQMADGGYNCDETAYLVADECPSSMVGTVAPLEALTTRGPGVTADRAAGLLIARALRHGSPTRHNAEERVSAERWGQLCFPRFYFYDHLRGLSALVAWATAHGRTIPLAAIAETVDELLARAPDGVLRLGRAPVDEARTIAPDPTDATGAWVRRPADHWPLLDLVSRPGEVSPALTRQWTATRRGLLALIDRGAIESGP